MNECAIATLPNNTLVMNARNYVGQANFTVKRAIMWSHDEGDSCEWHDCASRRCVSCVLHGLTGSDLVFYLRLV